MALSRSKPAESTYFGHAAKSISNCVLGLLCTSPAPGTIGMRQLFFTKEIYFAMSEIRFPRGSLGHRAHDLSPDLPLAHARRSSIAPGLVGADRCHQGWLIG